MLFIVRGMNRNNNMSLLIRFNKLSLQLDAYKLFQDKHWVQYNQTSISKVQPLQIYTDYVSVKTKHQT